MGDLSKCSLRIRPVSTKRWIAHKNPIHLKAHTISMPRTDHDLDNLDDLDDLDHTDRLSK